MGAPSKDTCLGSPGRQEKRDKRHGRFRGDQEQACDRHQEPAASPALFTLASRLALGSAPISEAARVTQVPTSRRLHRVDSAFLPWAPLPSLRRHAASEAHFHELARPSATTRLRSHHEQQLLHSGWLGDQGARPHRVLRHRRRQPSLSLQAFVLSPLVPDELGVAALRPSRGGGHASGHRGRSTAVDCNKPCSSNTSRWSGCALSSSSQCTLACSLQPPYTPVPSPAADDTCRPLLLAYACSPLTSLQHSKISILPADLPAPQQSKCFLAWHSTPLQLPSCGCLPAGPALLLAARQLPCVGCRSH